MEARHGGEVSECKVVRIKVKGAKRLMRSLSAYHKQLMAVTERILAKEKLRLYFEAVMGGEE